MNKLSELIGKIMGPFNAGNIEAMWIKGLQATLVLLVAFLISRWLQRLIDRRLRLDNKNDEAAIRTYKKVARFIIMVPGLLIGLHILGINLSAFFTTSGLFALAAAFAMKNIAENLVSGMMLRFERTIKPGDVLETEGIMVRVKKVGFRATTVRTKDERDLLIPNSQLVQDRVANYTYKDSLCRVWMTVGVSYSSDLYKVREVLEGVCNKMVGLSEQHAPEVLLTDFGDSSVNYKVSVWIEDPWNSGPIKSDLNEAIWRDLNKAGIVIAFPQLDVHFDEAFRNTKKEDSSNQQ
jgi:small-conductance mechanosensitive channel